MTDSKSKNSSTTAEIIIDFNKKFEQDNLGSISVSRLANVFDEDDFIAFGANPILTNPSVNRD